MLDCSAILLASSLTVIASGIFMSLFTGFKFSLFSSLFALLSSFCLALFTDAKLLSLVSISSLKALETVRLTCLLFEPNFDFLSLSESLFIFFVALCSASFLLSKSDVDDDVLGVKFGFKLDPVLNFAGADL